MVETKNANREKENNYTEIEEPENLTPTQQTCDICGLTARNREELKDHISNAHTDITGLK
jgi:hypothetical protein